MLDVQNLTKELKFKGIRSGGAGGQHVNKVSSKIELTFNISTSKVLSEDQKELLLKKLSSRLTKENVLILFCDESRSQHKNKEIAIERFLEVLKKGLKKPKSRKKTKPSRASIKKRLANKKKLGEKKISRKKTDLDT